jgi:replicative DNA helicase
MSDDDDDEAEAHQAPSRRAIPAAADLSPQVRGVLGGGGAADRVRSGFPSLDNLLGGGFRRGDVVVLAGDVSAGKSALALAVALRARRAGHAVAFLSGEMPAPRIVERALALEARVRIDDLRRESMDDSVRSALSAVGLGLRDRAPVLAQLPDSGVPGVSDFLVEQLGLELAVIDPLQYVAIGSRTLDEELASAARALKELAMRRSACVFAVAQLGRAVRGRPDPRPTLEDLGGAGAISQHADVVLGLYREEVYDPSPHIEGAAELRVLKNRNGPTGLVDLYFYRQWLRFEDMIEPDA